MRPPLLLALTLLGCAQPPREPPSRIAPEPTPEVEPEPVAPPVEPAPGPSIDLLQSATTYVAVSSAYRDEASQVASLVDGSLATAWNSRTGDLVGAFIEVRVPVDAVVTSIALTAGFTHESERVDLFTGNHRVARVRVAHDGAVTEHALDPDSRTLQTIPIEGGGGVYRIEIAAVLPGSNARWQEACVSELRVMGRAPGAQAGRRYPHLAVGALPAPHDVALDPAALAAAFPGEIAWLARAWADHERAEHSFDASTADCDDPSWSGVQWTRRRILERVAAFVERADVVAADALRRREWLPRARPACLLDDRRRHGESEADLTAIAAGLDAVLAHLDDAARCRWSRAHVELRVLRLAARADSEWYVLEYRFEYREVPAERRRAEGRRQGVVGDLRTELADWSWPSDPGALARLRRLDRTALPEDGADFDALNAELDRVERWCGAP